MIKLLHIENIAVIESADIEFGTGLNVLTGETGAGKSIVIDALSAVIGARTSRDLLRTGAENASVTAVFDCSSIRAGALPDFAEPDENNEIYLMRKITADGKSTCRINNTPVQANTLKELGAVLLDIHGQNDGRKLLDEDAHLGYLDAFGVPAEAVDTYKKAYEKLTALQKEIDRLTINEEEKARRIDTLRFQINEIEQAQIRPGELDELTARRELLLNASKLTDAVETAFEALYGGSGVDGGGGDSQGAVTLISNAYTALDNASKYSEELRAISGRLNDIQYTAQDAAEELRDFRAGLDFTPGELDALEERLDIIKRVTRKYGGPASFAESASSSSATAMAVAGAASPAEAASSAEAGTLAYMERAANELSDMEDSGNKLSSLENELRACLAEAKKLALDLSGKRKAAAADMSARVKDELKQLNMPGVKFTVEFSDVGNEHGLDATGCDEVRYLMSANPGEAPGRINRIASGGELARIMLALKNVLGAASDSSAMVFDEIDTGVSGIAAQRVGEKLATLARNRQVLCVTHLPQIAVMADTHFSISKEVSGGRTFTHVTQLDDAGRRDEIARLTGGENITDVTLASAQEQLKAAEEFKRGL